MRYILANIRVTLIISLAFIIMINVASAEDEKLDIFIDGCHLDEPIPDPDNWYEIYAPNTKNKNLSVLKKVSIQTTKELAHVDDLYNFCIKSHPDKGNNNENSNSIILVKGSIFSPRNIQTAVFTHKEFTELSGKSFSGGRRLPKTDEIIKIRLGKLDYILHQETNLDDHSTGPNHILTLTHNEIPQVIFKKRGNYEGATGFYIIWAGDIDNDNKLDLIVNLPETYAAPYHLRMYLSSYAKDGEHVHQVADRVFSSP